MNPSSPWNQNLEGLIKQEQVSSSIGKQHHRGSSGMEGKSVSCSPSTTSTLLSEMMTSSTSSASKFSHFTTTQLSNEMLNSIRNDIHMTKPSSSIGGATMNPSSNTLLPNMNLAGIATTSSALSSQSPQQLSVIIPSASPLSTYASTSIHHPLENLNQTNTPSPLTPSSTTSATTTTCTPSTTFLKLNVEELLVDLHQEQQQQQHHHHHNTHSILNPSPPQQTPFTKLVQFQVSQQQQILNNPSRSASTLLSNTSSSTTATTTGPTSTQIIPSSSATSTTPLMSSSSRSFDSVMQQQHLESQNSASVLLQQRNSSLTNTNLMNQVMNASSNVVNSSSSTMAATSTTTTGSQVLLPKQFTIFGNQNSDASSLMMSNILSSHLPNTMDDQSRKSSTATTSFLPSLTSGSNRMPSLTTSSTTTTSSNTPNAFTTFQVATNHDTSNIVQLSSTLGEPVTELTMTFQDSQPLTTSSNAPMTTTSMRKKKSGMTSDTSSIGEASPTLSQQTSKKRNIHPTSMKMEGVGTAPSRKKNKGGPMQTCPPLKIIPSSLTSVTFHNTSQSSSSSMTPTVTTPTNYSIMSSAGSHSSSSGGNIQFVTNEFQEFKSGQHETQKRQRKERIYKFYSTVPSNFSTQPSSSSTGTNLNENSSTTTSQQMYHEERSPSFSSSSPRM
ncbi:hypothetical protein C9374_012246 [Naegleria lovaniensis]|uniref:Uncharacterized protein n=1 Tax=Naegleria lovaniensis TaxID=51637 RepID=A0AA88G7T5_NAELO|nr:uncharacterized protein C9374_012246 [Naegleria lovaniensis]KAG2373380.1 hypothetical protein C9374_012246 [Naegleria lovaniensis]